MNPPPATLPSLRAQLFAATWLSYAGFYFCRKVFGVVRGPLRDALGRDDLAVSHLWTVFLLSYMLGQFVTAALGRRLPARQILIGGMLASSATTWAAGAVLWPGRTRYLLLLLAMAMSGWVQATGWASNVALMTNWTRRTERGRIMAIWGTCYQIGSVLAKAFAAFVFGWLGLMWSFWGAALVLLVVTLLFVAMARESPESVGLPPMDSPVPLEPSTSRAASAAGSGQPALSSPGATAVEDAAVLRRIVAMGLIYFSFKFVRYALDSWSALLASEHFHASIPVAGYLSTMFDWMGFAGVLCSGWISDRLFGGRRSPVIFGMTVGCFFSTVLLWTIGLSSIGLYAALLGLIGFLAMGPDSLLSGACAMDVGSRKHAAFAAAMINGLGAIGPIFEEPLIGWAKTTHGLSAVFFVLVAMMAIAVLATGGFWWALRRDRMPL